MILNLIKSLLHRAVPMTEEEVEWSLRIDSDGKIGLAALAEIANKTVITPKQLAELKERLAEGEEYDPRPTAGFLNRTYSI